MKECTLCGVDEFYARGYCKNCYRRERAAGRLEKAFNTRPTGDYSNNTCSECGVIGCQLTKTKCRKCYQKQKDQEKYYKDPAKAMQKVKEWQDAHPERVKEVKRESYHRHREELLAKGKIYRDANKDEIGERVRARYAANKEEFKYKRIAQVYGLGKEEYLEMVKDQDSACAICKVETTLVIDHDHKTGKVRQLLCGDCNTTLGFIERRGIDVFASAGEYLKTHT